jgi:HK97 gp10 family phage protein
MDKLQRQIARAPDVVKRHTSTAVGLSSLRIARRARELVPVDSGFLKSEIDTEHDSGSLEGHVGIRSRGGFYWGFIEFGTVHMSARPFFRPAAEEGQAGFVRDVADAGPDIELELTE